MDIRSWIIITSLAIVIIAYLALSRREGNFINVLFPYVLLNIPALFLLELLYLKFLEPSGSVYAYFYCYTVYATSVVAMVLAYLATPAKWVPIFVVLPRIYVPGVAWMLLACAVLLFAPILVEHSHLLGSPREIYTATRTGFGIGFFLSTFAAYFSLIVLWFSRPSSRIAKCLFFLIIAVLIYLHGSKSQLLFLLLIYLCYVVFVQGKKFEFGSLVAIGGSLACGIVLLFYLTLSPAMKQNLALGIATYSDYTRNASLVIDDRQLELQKGRLTLEASLYSIIPRAMFPDKPKDFGNFWLAKRYYPEWFEADTGSPAFGIGVSYADFGVFSLAWELLVHLVAGCFLKILVTRLRILPDPGSFILLLVLLGIALIPAGSPVPFLVYYLFAHAANMLAGFDRGGGLPRSKSLSTVASVP